MTYCVVPAELRGRLRSRLERVLSQHGIEVVTERRRGSRRRVDRREGTCAPTMERRVTRGPSGRRVAERRAVAVGVDGPPLPWSLRRHAARLAYFAPVVPAAGYLDDARDTRLVLRTQLGDREALRDLYMQWFDEVHCFCRVSLDATNAEEATQEALSSACLEVGTLDPTVTPVRTLFYEHALAAVRRREELPETVEAREASCADLDKNALRSALGWVRDHELAFLVGRLPAPQREVLLLRHLGGLSEMQTAAVLDLDLDSQRALHDDAVGRVCETLEAVGRGAPSTQREAMRRLSRASTVIVRRRRALMAG